MKVLSNRSVSEALYQGIQHICSEGYQEDSRNGPVLVSPMPVVTASTEPRNRVLFSSIRDANPFFHLMESLWMLAGRDDLAFPLYFNSGFSQYSDDGKTLWGAYGYRWRKWFPSTNNPSEDQLTNIIAELKRNPTSRRCVLAMWDATDDHLPATGQGTKKDLPCNTHIYFNITNDSKLDMTVCCRSNDLFWGAHGANAVHMSILHEYIAGAIKHPMGTMYQVSNNYHAYTEVAREKGWLKSREDDKIATDLPLISELVRQSYRYEDGVVTTTPLLSGAETTNDFDADLETFFEIWDNSTTMEFEGEFYNTKFFNQVAIPMIQAYMCYKRDDLDMAHLIVNDGMPGKCDWKFACSEWVGRRMISRANK